MQWVLPNAEVEVLFVDERPSDVQVPSAIEMKVTQTEPGRQRRHGLGRRHQAGDARVRRGSRYRSSSRRARRSGSTRAPANTSPAPERPPGPGSGRIKPHAQVDQRRDAVFACYQRDVTGRPLDELSSTPSLHPRLAEGVEATAKSSTRSSPATRRAGIWTGSPRSTST